MIDQILRCEHCNLLLNKRPVDVRRALKVGMKLYCNRVCAGLGRRTNKSLDQKKLEKQEYDRQYRLKNKDRIKEKKQAYNRTESGRETQKRNRDKMKERHLEYCRTDKYKQWKKEYDLKHRAKKNYGEYWESAILLNEVFEFIPNREIKQQLQLTNKSQKRKRDYEKTKCKKFKRCSLGNIE